MGSYTDPLLGGTCPVGGGDTLEAEEVMKYRKVKEDILQTLNLSLGAYAGSSVWPRLPSSSDSPEHSGGRTALVAPSNTDGSTGR